MFPAAALGMPHAALGMVCKLAAEGPRHAAALHPVSHYQVLGYTLRSCGRPAGPARSEPLARTACGRDTGGEDPITIHIIIRTATRTGDADCSVAALRNLGKADPTVSAPCRPSRRLPPLVRSEPRTTPPGRLGPEGGGRRRTIAMNPSPPTMAMTHGLAMVPMNAVLMTAGS